ncbi:MAG: hypothetical protein O7G83_20845 [Proteobacteria bacterium]|nr:hypothetical protein [Pseudomonadota bacterium]
MHQAGLIGGLDRFSKDYRMPRIDNLQEYLDEIGLTGDFWKISDYLGSKRAEL